MKKTTLAALVLITIVNAQAYDPLKTKKVAKNPNHWGMRQIDKARSVQFPLRK